MPRCIRWYCLLLLVFLGAGCDDSNEARQFVSARSATFMGGIPRVVRLGKV